MAVTVLFILACLGAAMAETLGSMDQGAEFTKCIKTTDWEGKTLNDNIELAERDANGCCADGYVPGVKHYENYVGAQVVCGFKDDGAREFTAKTTNGVRQCTYNKCFIWKQNVPCVSGTQRLNGCCAAKESCKTNACNFKEGCKNYAYDDPFHGARYCLTYNSNYKMEKTSAKTDDVKDGKLQIENVYQYTKCKSSPPPSPEVDGAQWMAQVAVGPFVAMLTAMFNA